MVRSNRGYFQLAIALLLFLVLIPSALAGPVSSNYELQEYGFGGGGNSANSSNYSIFGTAGEVESGRETSTNYAAGEGLTYTVQADVPPAPTLTNPANYYNRLKIVLNQGPNPSDATYAIAISADSFATDTRYVQNDQTVGPTLGAEDFQAYSSWGGAGGALILGLVNNTTYTVKVAARHGAYTQTGFGPTAQATTSNPALTFDLDVAATDIDTDPPFAVSLGELSTATVITAPNRVWVDVDTNGTAGAAVYVVGQNGGLLSSAANATISSVSVNLASAAQGYGARGASATQSSGGPMQAVAPYNGASDNVGVVDTLKRIIFDSNAAAVTAGRASFELKAKASAVTRAGSDYGDTLTVIATAVF